MRPAVIHIYEHTNKMHFSFFSSDMSKNPNLSKNSPATPAAPEPVAPGPRQHQRKNQQKKKKNNRF